MDIFERVKRDLRGEPKTWLVTGVAGFIGSNLLETLLKLDQAVVGLDNFATGYRHNLDEVRGSVTVEQWARFRFIEGDIRNVDDCKSACAGVDFVLHQAALGSVPRSLSDPVTTNATNIDGYLNMLVAARDAGVRSFTYAASSSTYGDHPSLPKVEDVIGKPLSPYAVTKYVNELYASVFRENYGFCATGLRYFNVFGKRQDPAGAYAAVIPKWIALMISGREVYVNGDGETSRDFCFVENVVQANILAALAGRGAQGEVFNIACGERTSLNTLFELLVCELRALGVPCDSKRTYADFRAGDVRHSEADVSKATRLLGYRPIYNVRSGLKETMPWYLEFLR